MLNPDSQLAFSRSVKCLADSAVIIVPVGLNGLGNDLEAQTIKEILTSANVKVIETVQGWGANFNADSSLIEKINGAQRQGLQVYAIELGGEAPEGVVKIDHHNDRTFEPASLLQVIKLLGREPTRKEILIAANDTAWIPGMLMVGATIEEALEIRALDWQCQGITADEIANAQTAAQAAKQYGKTQIVFCKHNKVSPITDYLYDPLKDQDLLVACRVGGAIGIRYFGPKPYEILEALGIEVQKDSSTGSLKPLQGWLGGPLPNCGFAGCNEITTAQIAKLFSFLKNR